MMPDFVWLVASPICWKRVVAVDEMLGIVLRATTYDGEVVEHLTRRVCAGAWLLERK